jgi:hypothetical protein
VVAENDLMIQPDMQRDLAKTMNATTTSYPSSHVVAQTKPQDVANAILAAVAAVP